MNKSASEEQNKRVWSLDLKKASCHGVSSPMERSRGSPVSHPDDRLPSQLINCNLTRNPQPEPCSATKLLLNSQPQKLHEVINVSCSKLLSFRVICYVLIDNIDSKLVSEREMTLHSNCQNSITQVWVRHVVF